MVTNVHFSFENDPKHITNSAVLDTTIECPDCGNKNSFEFPCNGIGIGGEINYIVKCQNCKKFFIAKYFSHEIGTYKYEQTFSAIYPSGKFKHKFPQEIENISSKFIEIYQQAMTAKNQGLNELVGIGLRKAIEFLIYDYIKNVLALEPAKTLENRIKQINVQNVNVHSTLVRWVGNDNTHVEIKHPEFSIAEMIKSIDLVVYYLFAEYKSKEIAEKIMAHPSRQ